uniref:NACHT domain-containing protein n=1 Tax=Hucho hucho TaxID=62062 RepID=A0A4W5LP48_9TELE
MLTKGVAGIGKTVSVQKFILDWAEGIANQDLQFVFSFTFRELNLMKGEKHTLIELLNHFSTGTKQSRISNYDKYKVLFIFDGLDECRLPLDFQKNEICWDVTESTSVNVLLTNLIKGNLLPSALLWITTRPAAANKIPSGCVDQVTEAVTLSSHRGRLCFSGLSSEVKPLTPERAGPELQSPRRLRSQTALCWTGGSTLQTGGTEVCRGFMSMFISDMFDLSG